MSAQFSFSEPVLTAKCDLQHTFANPCLKRKLETEVKNGFVAVQHHEMCSAEQEYNFISEVSCQSFKLIIAYMHVLSKYFHRAMFE